MRSGRRRVLGVIGGSLAAAGGFPSSLLAQQAGRVHRLGIFGIGASDDVRRAVQPFLGLLAKAGFAEGKNLEVVIKAGASDSAPPDPVAAELVAAKPDAILVASPAVIALKRHTATIPIVAVIGFDPVAAGLVASLAHPGGNVTGVSLLSVETGDKRVELIKEAFPGVRRVHYLNQKGNMHFNHEAHARRLGLSHEPLPIESAADLDAFFARPLGRDEAIHVATSQLNFVLREAIVAHANRARAQIVYPFVECVAAGGLIAYAGDLGFAMARAMNIVARIFSGADPAGIAFEQATRVVLVVNLRTARQIGIAIPQSVLLRADRVIE
jgi:putative tryptophan/tyrosine transport system substrate-binding protein